MPGLRCVRGPRHGGSSNPWRFDPPSERSLVSAGGCQCFIFCMFGFRQLFLSVFSPSSFCLLLSAMPGETCWNPIGIPPTHERMCPPHSPSLACWAITIRRLAALRSPRMGASAWRAAASGSPFSSSPKKSAGRRRLCRAMSALYSLTVSSNARDCGVAWWVAQWSVRVGPTRVRGPGVPGIRTQQQGLAQGLCRTRRCGWLLCQRAGGLGRGGDSSREPSLASALWASLQQFLHL
jgi:hypothetical protein